MAQPQENFCVSAKRGITDVTRSVFGILLAAAAVTAAATNAERALAIAEQEYDLAKKYWQLAENWLNYYKDNYAPVEDQELIEAMALPKATPEYDVARGRARSTALIKSKGLVNRALRRTTRYCTGARQVIIADAIVTQAASVAMAEGLGWRNERAYVEQRNEVRFKKQLATAKRGRNIVADTVSFASLAAGIYGNIVDQAWAGVVGAGQFLGYELNRREPVYPQTNVSTRMNPPQNRGYRIGAEEQRPMYTHGNVTVYEPYGAPEEPVQIQERTI